MLERRAVRLIATALKHYFFVPLEPVLLECSENRVCGAGRLTRAVEILHADQPFAFVPARLEVAAGRSDERAEMQRTRWGGSKAPTIGFRRVMHNLVRKSYQCFPGDPKIHDQSPSHRYRRRWCWGA